MGSLRHDEPRRFRGLLRDTAGNATAEAVIMLPFFIMVWGFIIWASQSFEYEIDMAAKTREHAWTHALASCPSFNGPNTTVSDASGGLGALDEIASALDTVIGLFPGVGDWWPGISFDEHEYVREGYVEGPEVTGSDPRYTRFHTTVMCNEEHETPSLDETAWSAFGLFGGGL